MLTAQQLRAMARGRPNAANMNSLLVAVNEYGPKIGLDQPHRLAQFLAQALHESGSFRYDREIWGPTPAQKRYEDRKDLGHSKAVPGEAKLFSGKGPFQLTGRDNHRAFTKWALLVDPRAPDFERSPKLVNTDPWEGLSALWYWDTRGLNRYADAGDVEMITKRINGGLNGYADRLAYLARASLVLLGYGPEEVKRFQKDAGLAVDGIAGPRTRAAMHKRLVAMTAKTARSGEVAPAPVTEEKPTVPKAVEKEVKKKTGLWGWLVGVFSGGSAGIAALSDADWTTVLAIGGVGIVGLVVIIFMRRQIIEAVKDIRHAVEQG